jgi:chaperone BCS1
MSSIVLEPAVKEMLLADCREFLRSEDWYVSYFAFT